MVVVGTLPEPAEGVYYEFGTVYVAPVTPRLGPVQRLRFWWWSRRQLRALNHMYEERDR